MRTGPGFRWARPAFRWARFRLFGAARAEVKRTAPGGRTRRGRPAPLTNALLRPRLCENMNGL